MSVQVKRPKNSSVVCKNAVRQGYLTNKGIESMRSAFGNDIFRNEQYKLFKQQTEYREELKESFDMYS